MLVEVKPAAGFGRLVVALARQQDSGTPKREGLEEGQGSGETCLSVKRGERGGLPGGLNNTDVCLQSLATRIGG